MLGSAWDHFLELVWYNVGTIWGLYWDYFGILVEPFWNHFGMILDHLGSMLVSIWEYVGIVVGPFGIILGSFWAGCSVFDVRMFDVRCYVRTGRCYVMLVLDLDL